MHDYTRKRGVESAEILLPDDAPAWAADRSALWNAVEAKNKRADAQVAREIVVALPDELSPPERGRLVLLFAQEIAQTYRVAVDLAIHRPGAGGDDRNHHAHLLLTTNRLGPDGLGNKVRAFDGIAAARGQDRAQGNAVERLRERWAELTNAALERAGRPERIDHRSFKAQGIEDREPTRHLGPGATAVERRSGEPSRRREAHRAETAARVAAVRELKELERQSAAVAAAIRHAEQEGRDWERIAEGLREFEAYKAARAQAAAEPRERETRDSAERAAAAKARADRDAEREAMREAHRRQVAEILRRPPTVSKETAAQAAERKALETIDRGPPGTAEKLYAKMIEQLERGDQAAATSAIEALRIERWQLEEARSTHRKGEPMLFKAKWKKAGEALDKADEDLASREIAAASSAHPKTIEASAKAQLAATLPKLVERADAERQAREARERQQERQAQAAKLAEQARTQVAKDFASLALKRESRSFGFGDHSDNWKSTPAELRDRIDDYIKLPKERRPAELERINNDPKTRDRIQGLMQERERNVNELNRRMGR